MRPPLPLDRLPPNKLAFHSSQLGNPGNNQYTLYRQIKNMSIKIIQIQIQLMIFCQHVQQFKFATFFPKYSHFNHIYIRLKQNTQLCTNIEIHFPVNFAIIFLSQKPHKIMQCKFVWDGDVFKKRKRQRVFDSTFTTKFPSDKIRQEKFDSSQKISTFLLKNALEIGICKWQYFQKYVVDKGQYLQIIYSCKQKGCDARLIYRQEKSNPKKPLQTNFLTQISIQNYHSHTIKLNPKLANEQNIRQYLFDLPVQEKFQNHVEIVRKKFNLNRLQATKLKERVFWKFKDEDHMLRKLTERNVSFRRKKKNDKTIILLLVSESMKKNYLNYGDNLCFDITYKLLMRKRDETRHLGIGFFIGQDGNSRIILFGVATIHHQTRQDFMELFSYFFEVMEFIPQTILTDDQKALGSALQQLKAEKGYDYIHLLDWFHKMEALRRLSKREPCRQQLFTLFNRMIKEPSQQVVSDIVDQIAGLLDREQIMRDFLRDGEKCILSQVPEVFFAFGISSTRAEAFNGLIKRWVPHQTNIGRLIYFVLRVQKRLNNRMAVLNYIHPQLLSVIDDEEVLKLSNCLQCLPFQQIRQYYEEARSFESVKSGTSPIHKYITYIKYERQYRFNLMYDIEFGCWRCQCRNNFRTGMPCSHIVRVVRQNKGCIGYYINQRWFHDKDNAQIKKACRPSLRSKKI